MGGALATAHRRSRSRHFCRRRSLPGRVSDLLYSRSRGLQAVGTGTRGRSPRVRVVTRRRYCCFSFWRSVLLPELPRDASLTVVVRDTHSTASFGRTGSLARRGTGERLRPPSARFFE